MGEGRAAHCLVQRLQRRWPHEPVPGNISVGHMTGSHMSCRQTEHTRFSGMEASDESPSGGRSTPTLSRSDDGFWACGVGGLPCSVKSSGCGSAPPDDFETPQPISHTNAVAGGSWSQCSLPAADSGSSPQAVLRRITADFWRVAPPRDLLCEHLSSFAAPSQPVGPADMSRRLSISRVVLVSTATAVRVDHTYSSRLGTCQQATP